jgi:hypothetical protein
VLVLDCGDWFHQPHAGVVVVVPVYAVDLPNAPLQLAEVASVSIIIDVRKSKTRAKKHFLTNV